MPFENQQVGFTAARRIMLAVFLVASVVLLVVYCHEGKEGPVHSVQNAVTGVTGTAGRMTSFLGVVTETVGNGASDATARPETLTALRTQNEELRQKLAQADEYRQEAERLQALLDMKQVSGTEGPAAHIIGRSMNAWDQSITIDLGSEDGVEAGMTVMGAYGVIGQVSRVQPHTATVRLLTDPNSGAAVMIQSSRANGIVRGSISGLLYLEDLEEDQIPSVGDVVVTSGLGGSYERGLIVGMVVSVNKTAANTTGSVIVSPNDNASALEEVHVVFSAPNAPAAEPAKDSSAAKDSASSASAATTSDQQGSTNGTATDSSYSTTTGVYDSGTGYSADSTTGYSTGN